MGSLLQIPLFTAADLHDAAAADSDDNGTDWGNGDSEDSEGDFSEGFHPLVFSAEQGSPRKRIDKKMSLWRNWALKPIPELLEPYLNLLRESEN